jgi:glycosyltransferase involved in cell wall biosynthesis
LIAFNKSVVLLNNSRAGAHDYEHWIGLQRGTISILQNAFLPESAKMPDHAETERFRQSLGLRDGSPIVGTLMRFAPEKDPLLWLETAAQISRLRPDVRFLIGGYGDLGPEMEHRIKERGLGGSVVLAGPIADPGLAYSVMDTVLLTSMVEGIPNVAVEAQAMGRPVVVTNVGGAPEAVLANRTGIVVSERSAEALAKAVINTLDDRCWRDRVSSEGPKFVSARFALARMIDETLDHYGWPRSLFS